MQKGSVCMKIFSGNLGKIMLAAICGYAVLGQVGALLFGGLVIFLLPSNNQ
jgi:hypothetical protein